MRRILTYCCRTNNPVKDNQKMTKKKLTELSTQFREAIEKARDSGEFAPSKPYMSERMNSFPHDCCDDTADLLTHYLYHEYGIDSIRVDGSYYDERLQCEGGHSWQITEGWVIDLTGDQFDNNPAIQIKIPEKVFVGKKGAFHRQFKENRREHSCGIECLGHGSWDRMYGLYKKIIKNLI